MQFGGDAQRDLVADRGHVLVDAPGAALERTGGVKTHDVDIGEGVLALLVQRGIQRHRMRLTMQGQVPDNLEAVVAGLGDRSGREAAGWVLLGVKEVGAHQVLEELAVAGVDVHDTKVELDHGLRQIGLVNRHATGEIGQDRGRIRETKVVPAKADHRM